MSTRARDARERARRAAAQRRAAEQRRRRLVIAGAAVAVVLVALATLVVVRLTTGGRTPTAAASAQPAPSTVLTAATGVPAQVLDTVGAGKVAALPKTVSGQPVLTADGKPLVLYVGAEYCPFCAAERWPMVVALSRFGTFTNLGVTHSASDDVYPNTATLSFHGATYTSDYLAFQGVETRGNTRQGNTYNVLDPLTAEQQKLVDTFNAPPYVSADAAGSIPFVDFANQAVLSGASYSPQLLAGKTPEQIAAALSQPDSDIAQAVDGNANAFTALLCTLTKGQPGAVCGSRAVAAYQGKFGG